MQNLPLYELENEPHQKQLASLGPPRIDNGAHGTENLLNAQVSEDFP